MVRKICYANSVFVHMFKVVVFSLQTENVLEVQFHEYVGKCIIEKSKHENSYFHLTAMFIQVSLKLCLISKALSCAQDVNFLIHYILSLLPYPCMQVDVIVSSAGGVEEDFIKCLAPTFLGDFRLSGKELRLKGINRIGNLLVPNDNYVKFEDWIMPIFDQMLEEQKKQVDGYLVF